MSIRLARRVQALVALTLILSACGGGDSSGPPAPASTVEESLTALDVKMTPTPPVDADKQALPSSYTPFGTSRTFDRTDQLAVVGLPLSPTSFGFDSTFTILEQQVDLQNRLSTQALLAPGRTSTPWALAVGETVAALRTVAAGDVDGDGLDELLVVTVSGEGAASAQLWQDANAGYAVGSSLALDLGGLPLGLALTLADFDGDGSAEAALAWTDAAGAHLRFYEVSGAGLLPEGAARNFTPEHAGATVGVELAAGNLDWDAGAELVLVLNESWGASGQEAGSARYLVLDDTAAGHAESARGLVRGSAEGVVRTAVLAGVAVGDLDADGLDEVVFGGLTGLDPARTCAYAYVMVALDDLRHGLVALGAAYVSNALQDSGAGNPPPQCDAADPLRLRKVFVRTFDADQNGAAEIQVNQLTFRDFLGGIWTAWGTGLPLEYLFGTRPPPEGAIAKAVILKGTFDATTAAMAAADFTLDRAGDVAVMSRLAGRAVRIWSFSNEGLTSPQKWHLATSIPLAADPGAPERPLLVAANVKPNGLAVKYSDGSYRLVFTEPIVLAALAAPPCSASLGQDLSVCRTTFGKGTSSTTAVTKTYSVSVARMIGVQVKTNWFGLESGFELSGKIKAEYQHVLDHAESVTSRITYTTGPNEDGVVFTSIPYDIYTYKVISHPTASYIGQEVVVALPRAPILTIAERGFYNERVAPGAPKIGAEVFTHKPGDVHSYPSASAKDALLATYGGFCSQAASVGQSQTIIGVDVTVSTEDGTADGYGIEAELELKLTAGIMMAGFTIGGGAESQLRVARGTEVVYAGAVGGIPNYGANGYTYGLFSYVYQPTDAAMRPFEVINYWVE